MTDFCNGAKRLRGSNKLALYDTTKLCRQSFVCFSSYIYRERKKTEETNSKLNVFLGLPYTYAHIAKLKIYSSCSVIVRVSVVLKRTVGDSD